MTDIDRSPRGILPGSAYFTPGAVSFGTYERGGEVAVLVSDAGRADHTIVTGPSGSGKTALLKSLLAGAVEAGIEARLIDPYQGDAQEVVEGFVSLLRQESTGQPLWLLLVDDLTGLDAAAVAALGQVARLASKANLAMVVASQDVRLGSDYGKVLQHLAGAELVEFSGPAPGVGTINGDRFRAWFAA